MRVLFIIVLVLYAMPPVLTLTLIWANVRQANKHRLTELNEDDIQYLAGMAAGSEEKEK